MIYEEKSLLGLLLSDIYEFGKETNSLRKYMQYYLNCWKFIPNIVRVNNNFSVLHLIELSWNYLTEIDKLIL